MNKKRVYRWYRLEACKSACAYVVANTRACIAGLYLKRFASTNAGVRISFMINLTPIEFARKRREQRTSEAANL